MKTNTQFSLFILLSAFFFFTACGTDTNQSALDESASDSAAVTAYTLKAFEPSVQYPDASIKSMTYRNGKFKYQIESSEYKLGDQTPDAPQKMCANSGQGQHIHLIVNNEPYVAQYVDEFEHEVADGEHYFLSFLSRSYHESLKTKAASLAQKVSVAGKTITKTEAITEPMVFYSRPKGNYVGIAETKKVMLDFFLVNATLSPESYQVKVLVNDTQEFTIDVWQPYYLEGLPLGENKIKLTLVDKDGNPVQTPLNPVERIFTLVDDPAPGQ